MPLNFFITGMPKCGKTTLLRKLIDDFKSRGLKVGGVISPEERHHGTRSGFYVKDIDSGRIGVLAAVDADGPKVSKYHVDVHSFESVALPALADFESCDVIVLDEIGWMELKSMRFADIIDRLLESDTPLVASLHTGLVDKYGPYGQVYELTDINHEAIYAELLGRVKAIVKKPMKKVEKKAEKKKAAPLKKEEKKAVPLKKPGKKTAVPVKLEEKPKKKGIFNHVKKFIGV